MKAHRSIPLRTALVLVALAGALLFALPLGAQTDPPVWCGPPVPPCDPNDPTSQCYKPPPPDPKCEPKECDKCTKSPCYVGSGVYETGAQDFAIPTTGFPLVVSRKYQSTQAIDGPLGFGWTSSVAAHLYYATYLFAAPSTYQKIAYVVMPNGSRYRFADNGNGTFSPPAGRHDSLVQNGDGTFDLTLQRTRSVLHFNALGALVSMTDDYGNALTITYDGSGRVQRIADAAGSGRYIDVFWGADGRISAVRDSANRQVQYAYNGQGGLSTATDAASRVTSYSYVPGRFAPLLSQIKDHWSRIVSTITYDTSDRVKTYTDKGETYTYTYAYGGNGAVTAKVDSQGNTFIYPFGSSGLVSDITPPSGGGGATHADYYPDGSVQQFIDGVGVKTYYTYTPNGSPLTVTRDYQGPNAVRFDLVYDTNFPEKVLSITPKVPSTGLVDPNWQAWRYDYWPPGSPAPGALRHVYRVQADGSTLDTLATYEYDSRGRRTRETSAIGGNTDYVYDAQGNLHTITGPTNNDGGTRPTTTGGYDSIGRVTSVSDPLGHGTSYVYDAVDRITSVTLPKPAPSSTLVFTTTYSYDNFDASSGFVFVQATDPNGRITKQGYDQYGQLVRSIDALNYATVYGYNRGLLTSIADANNNMTSYGYDSVRRLITTTFPDSAVERYTYAADGNLYQTTDRKNQTVTYGYDHLKRLASKNYPNSASVTYTYQGQKLTQVVDTSVSPTETHTFSYDSSYRLASETQATRGTITRTFNADDTPATKTVQSGPATTYTYYPDGSLNTIVWSPVSGNFKYTYTLPGQYQNISFPNGQTRSFSYDDQGRLIQLTNVASGGTNIATYAYGYDLNYTTGQYTMLGQPVSLTATVPSEGLSNQQTKYEFDSRYQLNKVTYPNVPPFNGEVGSWTYDAIGNRLTNTVNGVTQTYAYQRIGANPYNWQRLTNDGTNAYSYDTNGSTLTRNGPGGNYSFAWNVDNRMTSISGATTASYLYDYQGRRSTKTAGSAATYLYDGPNLVREAGTSTADYVFGAGADQPLAMSRSGQVYYYEIDALGSISTVTNSAALVQNTYLYDAWGQVRSQTGTLNNPFTYTSREAEAASLGFYRSRYYQPAGGRFLSEDTVHRALGTYTYVSNSPTAYRDPTGKDQCPSGCSCGPWSALKSGILDLGTRELWDLFKEEPTRLIGGSAGVGGEGHEAYAGCDCYYRRDGLLHMWQPYSFMVRSVNCPPCTTFQETMTFYGTPYETVEPVLRAPGNEPPPIIVPVPNTDSGCLCPRRYQGPWRGFRSAG